MEALVIPALGTSLLVVLIMLGEHNALIARLLCTVGLHVWPEHPISLRHRVCTRCKKHQYAESSQPQPWDWR